jgi:ribosome assembly protein RRB1
MSSHLTALAETEIEGIQGVDAVQVPLQKFKHKDEGYAIDWNPLVPGRLVSGNHCFFFGYIFHVFLFCYQVDMRLNVDLHV